MRFILAIVLLLPMLALAQQPAARMGDNYAALLNVVKQKQSTRHSPRISAAQAAEKARKEYGGKVLRVSRSHAKGRMYYVVKLVNHGRVHSVRIPAN